ncbi:MAG: CZB domain-containing protein [Azonexus sp.]|nr:CZB domain-containing protein [Azonexus sp.]
MKRRSRFGEITGHDAAKYAISPEQVVLHTQCRLGKWYYEGEGQACFSRLDGYRDIESPHVDVHRAGIEALRARQQGDMDSMLRHVEAMERASFQVQENLQRMADASSTSDVLCQSSP